MLARPSGSLVVVFASVLVPLGVSVVMSFGMASPPVPLVSEVGASPGPVDDPAPPTGEQEPPPQTWEEARKRRHARLKASIGGTHACGGLDD